MTDTILSTLGFMAATFGSILAWLSAFARTLWFGTVVDFKLSEVGLALVIAWVLYRLLQMFFDLFLDSWRSPAHDSTDLILGKLISLLFYGTLLLTLIAASVTYVMLLVITDPAEWLSLFFPLS
tara:strand:+ start:664 stop:1035 length:372 start_codon:yes stop_codon:yes gene_type:complete